MRRLFTIVLVSMVSLFGITACNSPFNVNGSGNVISETRQVSGFSSIDLRGFGDVTIQQGDTESLLIEGDDNIVPLLTSTVRDGQLILDTKNTIQIGNVTKLRFNVTVKELDGINMSGAGNVMGADINTEKITVRLSGTGNLTLSGTVGEQDVELSGVGNYDGNAFASKQAHVRVSGLGNAGVRVSDDLDALVSGMGSITYIGRPSTTKQISGAGSIQHVNE